MEWPRFAVLYGLYWNRRCSDEVLNTVQNLMVKHVEAGDSCDRAIGGTQLRQVEMLHDELIVVSCGFSCTYPTTPISSHSVLREWNANSTMTRNSRLYTMLSDEDMYRSQRIYASKNLGICFFLTWTVGSSWPNSYLLLVWLPRKPAAREGCVFCPRVVGVRYGPVWVGGLRRDRCESYCFLHSGSFDSLQPF